jgi:PHO85 cyclin-5
VIHAKVPKLVEKEKMRKGRRWEREVELNVSGKIIQGDLDAKEWQELLLNSVVANFIHALSFTSQLSLSNPDFTLNGLKLHLIQNVVKKPKVPSSPFPPTAPLPSPLLCPCCTFLHLSSSH